MGGQTDKHTITDCLSPLAAHETGFVTWEKLVYKLWCYWQDRGCTDRHVEGDSYMTTAEWPLEREKVESHVEINNGERESKREREIEGKRDKQK